MTRAKIEPIAFRLFNLIDFKPRHVFTFSVSPDLEIEAQSYYDGDGSLSLK